MTRKKQSNTITIDINEENVYAEYGYEDKLLLEDSLVDSIEYMASTRPIKQKLTFCFKETTKTDIDEVQFIEAYHNTFNTKIEAKKHEIGRCIITGVVLWLISLAFILFEQLVVVGAHPVVYEIVEIMSWVFNWVAVEALTIELIQLVLDWRKYNRLLSVDFQFVRLNEK